MIQRGCQLQPHLAPREDSQQSADREGQQDDSGLRDAADAGSQASREELAAAAAESKLGLAAQQDLAPAVGSHARLAAPGS